MSARIVIKVDGMTRWITADAQRLQNSFETIANDIKDEGIRIMRDEVPHGVTGKLADSVQGEVLSREHGGTIKIRATAPYAELLDGDGKTETHEILPRGKALKFVGTKESTGYVFARRVHHPGSKQTPFTKRTIERLREFAVTRVKEAIKVV